MIKNFPVKLNSKHAAITQIKIADSLNANAVIIENKKLLTTRERGRKLCLMPGGGIETGETPKQTLIRELNEELGISVNQNNLEFIGEFSAPATGRKTVRKTHLFLVKDHVGNIHPQNEIAEVKWISTKDLPKLSLEWILKHQIVPELLKRKLIS